MAKKNPDSTATTVSAKGKSAVNGGEHETDAAYGGE